MDGKLRSAVVGGLLVFVAAVWLGGRHWVPEAANVAAVGYVHWELRHILGLRDAEIVMAAASVVTLFRIVRWASLVALLLALLRASGVHWAALHVRGLE